MKYHFKIHEDHDGLWAECLELSGCSSQAENFKELEENMYEALNLYLDEPEDSRILFPLPKNRVKKDTSIAQVAVDPKVAFANLLRRARLEKNLTQTAMAKLLDYSSVFSYQKLESSKTANPTLLKVEKLRKILPNLRLDLLFS